MKNMFMVALLLCALAQMSFAQGRVFDWTRANAEIVQLDPADYHAGRVFHPGEPGRLIHIGIDAKAPVTLAMASLDDWSNAQQHPDAMANLRLYCLEEHAVTAMYECHLPLPNQMVVLVHDERTPDRVIVTGITAILGHGAHQFVAANDVHIQYYDWSCVQNCIQPDLRWVGLVKEKYEITSVPKTYTIFTPDHDGQPLHVKIKSPIPMTVAVMPSKSADQVYDNPETLSAVLDATGCKERGVQSMSFDCHFNVADGPQAIIIKPDVSVPSHKKAEVDLQTMQCFANCR